MNAPANDNSRPCPICSRPMEIKYRPFCSKRCADVDLNRWLSGSYAIPSSGDEDEDGAADSASSESEGDGGGDGGGD